MKKPIVSVCIPSYNRPEELRRLLNSIDSSRNDIEIVIKEDVSPKREEIRKVVEEFSRQSQYAIKYIENEENNGYDRNLRTIAKMASGEWIIYMGDDDGFVPHALDAYIEFLCKNNELGYVLRRYRNIYRDGKVEDYRYDQKNVFFKSGDDTIVELFRRSLFISGFTFRRECFNDYDCDDYDGSLLFQLYIMSVICKEYESCYCDILLTEAYEGGIPYFGVSDAEKKLYTSGANTIEGSLNFMAQVKNLAKSIDKKLNVEITDGVMDSYSKYSYGFLHEHRDDGLKKYNEYVRGLRKLGFDRTYHFNLYYLALVILGKNNCKKLICFIKERKGNTPKL